MLAALRNGESELAFEEGRADEAATALGGHRVDRMNVCIAATESDDAFGMAAGSPYEAVAVRRVVRDDRDAAGFEAHEHLRLRISDRFFGAEILDVRRRD